MTANALSHLDPQPIWPLAALEPGACESAATLAPAEEESFAERFCCHFNVSVENFESALLRRTLPPHARWLNVFAPSDFFLADHGFISRVGELQRRRDFDSEAKAFQRDPCNGTFLRRRWRLRVSVGRMRRLLDTIWPESQAA